MLFGATSLCSCLLTFGLVQGGLPLTLKQKVPASSESDSSGAISGRIIQGSSRFHDELVHNCNPDIKFKDEEDTGADHYMTPRCRDKLDKLAKLVKNQWFDVRLRVTEAWDENNEHSSNSLHYEGRAVDITTSDRATDKYGMLARLAVDAGFDWVYYENRDHVHASVKKESNSGGSGGGCFTLRSQVRTSTGDSVSIEDVKVGDSVLTVTTSGELSYSPIISFMYHDAEKTGHFVQLHTEDDHTITLTPGHLIYKTSQENSTELPEDPVFASEVKEGDYLFVVPPDATDRGNKIPTSRVTRVGLAQEKGVTAPLTADGTIVVDSVVASCYAVTRHEGLAHLSFAPLRLLYHTVPSVLRGKPEGPSGYLKMLKKLGQLLGVVDGRSNVIRQEL